MSPEIPILDPLIWAKLPADAQRTLSGCAPSILSSLNLHFEDDGRCLSPAGAGIALGNVLLASRRANLLDTLEWVSLFVESLTRENPRETLR